MRLPSSLAIALASAAAMTFGATLPASAACKRMGFLVNDYGKDGPTKDAQELLEKDIAKWAAGQGIKTYTVNKKDVSCELFLNFIVFDEHTCTASATVCWDEKAPGKPAAAQDAKATGTPAAAGNTEAASEAKSEAKPDTKDVKKAAAIPADTKPAADAAAVKQPEATAAAKPSEPKADKVETGAVQAPKTQDTKPEEATASAKATPAKAEIATEKAKPATEQDASQMAAAAAERAAAAAERAAVAAERAAQAAMDVQNQNSASSASAVSAPASAPAADAASAVVQPITPLPSTSKP
ncbi:MAG: hypothetical protein ABL894_13310 [Hyphomicrobium sp.]